jgi:hypothetical protein
MLTPEVQEKIEKLVVFIKGNRNLSPPSGAGLSTKNAIRVFRDFQGIWSKMSTIDPQKLLRHFAAIENSRSRAIPERLGLKKEGIIRDAEWLYDHYVDHMLYTLLKSEWQGQQFTLGHAVPAC